MFNSYGQYEKPELKHVRNICEFEEKNNQHGTHEANEDNTLR